MSTRSTLMIWIALSAVLGLGCSMAAEPSLESSPLFKPATVMDVRLASLESQLFQMAFSEFDSLKSRQQGTRFIPQQISAYYMKSASGKNIDIVARYRQAEPPFSQEQAKATCEAMIKWVRFHLGVGDAGVPFENGSKSRTSALHQFIQPSEPDAGQFEQEWAAVLDQQTVIVGVVASLSGIRSATATCQKPLVGS